MKNKFYVTVFTPTYNRRDKIQTLFHSLCKQTHFNFEWLVVDDGSNDGTEAFFKNISNSNFEIRYIKKENGGKHTAINKGVELAQGKVFAIVDSDDYLLEHAIETIINWFSEIENKENFAGVAAQRGYSPIKPIGTFVNRDFIDAKTSERNALHIDGDKFEIFYTDILKKYPFPYFEGERFLTEAIVWNRISNDGYQLRWHKEILYICEYLENGLTDQKDRLVKNSPKGYALYIQELVASNISLKRKLGFYSYYYEIRKDRVGINEISREINCSPMMIRISSCLRKIMKKIRG